VLGRANERQALYRVLAVQAVSGRAALGRQEPRGLIEPQGGGRDTDAFGELGNPHAGHDFDGKPSTRLEGQGW
jgi:hypothetical protein